MDRGVCNRPARPVTSSMNESRIILRHLVFTGFGVKPARLQFGDGLNIIYGASNTGKSFTLKALNFMLGGNKPLPGIEQRRPYDTVLMGLTLPEQGDIT